jgi:hypothetical protein
MIVWGHGRKLEPLSGLIRQEQCPACGNASVLYLCVLKKDFRLYWIPVARWNSAYFLMCGLCQASAEIEKAVGQTLHQAITTGIDLTPDQIGHVLSGGKLSGGQQHQGRIGTSGQQKPKPNIWRQCPQCKEQIQRDASRCPHCRSEVKPWILHAEKWWSRAQSGAWYWLDESVMRWIEASNGQEPPSEHRRESQASTDGGRSFLLIRCKGCGRANRLQLPVGRAMKCRECARILAKIDPCQVLGVRPSATSNEVDAAYGRLVQIYHPDRFGASTETVRAEAEARMKDLNLARDLMRSRMMDPKPAPAR